MEQLKAQALTRRSVLRRGAHAAVAGALCAALPARLAWGAGGANRHQAGPPSESERAAMNATVQQFMAKFSVPGLSVAIACRGAFVYQEGFGHADDARAPVTPAHLFRIASVSKPITAATVLFLVEQGFLGLDDLVFGPRGHLGLDYGNACPEDVQRITVRHLLTHTCGGWGNESQDPMFSHREMEHRELIAWTLANQPLKYLPGTHFSYSNFGYCVLGRLIEKLMGQSYRDYVQEAILARCGVHSMQLATNERAPGEVRYYAKGQDPYAMNIGRMDAHGGWIASPSDLVKFALRVDGFGTCPDLLSPVTLRDMTTPSVANAGYACGWSVNSRPNWWHNGSLPGTTALLVRTASQLCWAALANTRSEGVDGINGDLDQMMWKLVQAVPAWQA